MSQLIVAGAAIAVVSLTAAGARWYSRRQLQKRFAAVLNVVANWP